MRLRQLQQSRAGMHKATMAACFNLDPLRFDIELIMAIIERGITAVDDIAMANRIQFEPMQCMQFLF